MNGFSIIIAAHNEGQVIDHTLRSILANKLDRPLQIIVVANGCTDDTAQKARAFGPAVQVIETPIGNKIHALNLGDKSATFFPRAFMDADVELSPTVLQSIADTFKDPQCRIAAPGCRHTYRGKNPLLAGYYHLWRSLPYVKRDMMARGFFAIDEQLRQRFGEFPSVTADDKFVRSLATPEERRVAEAGHTIVYMPGTFKDLLRVKTRWTYGNMELAATRPDLQVNDKDQHGGALSFIIRRPWLWIHMPVFLFVWWKTKRDARRLLETKNPAWHRAESSRAADQRVAPS